MAIKLHVKQVKPFKEISPTIDGKPLSSVKFGITVYESDKLDAIRDQYTSVASNDTLELTLAKLQKLEDSGDKSTEEYYLERANLRAVLENETQNQRDKLDAFYKEQVLFIKGATLEYVDDNGNTKEVTITDTRNAQPIESLWEGPEECLAVLLDTYFGVPSIKDSLSSKIVETVLNLQLDEKAKN